MNPLDIYAENTANYVETFIAMWKLRFGRDWIYHLDAFDFKKEVNDAIGAWCSMNNLLERGIMMETRKDTGKHYKLSEAYYE